MKHWMRIALAGTVAVMSIAATGNWLATVVETTGGHRMGNPDAKVKLAEFVSYTCPHCAHFEKESEGAIKIALIQPGKASVEIKHIIRDPIDLTAALLTNCGPKEKFFQNHTAFMLSQDEWMGKARKTTPAQRQRWGTGTIGARGRAIAGDLGFYDLMETRGYSRSQVDTCLNDEAKARDLAELSESYYPMYGINSTPSFTLDGKRLQDVHDWKALQQALEGKF